MKITIKEYDVAGYGDNHDESRFEATAKTSYQEWMTSAIRGVGETREEAIEDFYRRREEAAAYRDRFHRWEFVRNNPVSVEEIEED